MFEQLEAVWYHLIYKHLRFYYLTLYLRPRLSNARNSTKFVREAMKARGIEGTVKGRSIKIKPGENRDAVQNFVNSITKSVRSIQRNEQPTFEEVKLHYNKYRQRDASSFDSSRHLDVKEYVLMAKKHGWKFLKDSITNFSNEDLRNLYRI